MEKRRGLAKGVFILVILAFLISGASGALDYNETIYKTEEQLLNYALPEGNTPYKNVFPIYLAFADIDQTDYIWYMRFLNCNGLIWNSSYSEYHISKPFVLKIGGDVLGTGTIHFYKKSSSKADIWLVFNDFNRLTYTNHQHTTVNYDTSWCPTFNTGGPWCSIRTDGSWPTYPFGFMLGPSVSTPDDHKYWYNSPSVQVSYGKVFLNQFTAETSGIGHQIEYYRVFGSTSYQSYVEIKTDEVVYYSSTASDNFGAFVIETPIYLNCKDSFDLWNNYTLYEGALTGTSIYGYVKNIKTGAFVSGVNVTLEKKSPYSFIGAYNTSSVGYYKFMDLASGSYYLNATKGGYNSFNSEIVILNTRRIDIPLTPSITPETGECIIYGSVMDFTTSETLNNTLVKVYNSTFSTYTYSNDLGFYQIGGLTNTSYVVEGIKAGYNKAYLDVTLPNLTEAYFYPLYLLAEIDEEGAPTPTPSPTVGPGEEGFFDPLLDSFGVLEEKNLLFSVILIAVLGVGFCAVAGGAPIALLLGAFLGYLISVWRDWLPKWSLAIVILVCVTYIAYLLADRR